MARAGASALVLLTGALFAAPAAIGAEPGGSIEPLDPGAPIAAASLASHAAAGEPIDLVGAVIEGDLDLVALDSVARVVRCTDCRFEGSIRATNVIFERVVDLSGSTVAGDADLQGAVFRDTFLMRRTPAAQAAVEGRVSFSLATFQGRASFEGARFGGEADFRVSQFLADASFADAEFGGDALFDSAIFAGRAQFSGASPTAIFGGAASFASVRFDDRADFRQRTFVGPASFAGSTFGSAEFTMAQFLAPAAFDDASFEGPASFRVAFFLEGVSFGQVVLGGPADFEAAVVPGEAQFHALSAAERLSLTEIEPPDVLGFEEVRATDLEMDLELVDRIPSPRVRESALTMIGSSARARGDIGLANEAAFRRSELETERATGLDRLVGTASQEIGGYLVQPVYPLRAILLLILVGTVVRTASHLVPGIARRRAAWTLEPKAAPEVTAHRPAPSDVRPAESEEVPARRDPGLLRVSKGLAVTLRSVAETLRAAVRLKPRDVPDDRRDDLAAYGGAFLAGGEWLAFKVLFGLFLVCLASSNPTFKQLVEAVT